MCLKKAFHEIAIQIRLINTHMDSYRPITSDEWHQILKSRGYKIEIEDDRASTRNTIIRHVNSYYPKQAYAVAISYNNEYDDCNYSTNVGYLGVYDINGNELLPIKSKAAESRKAWADLDSSCENSEPKEDWKLVLNGIDVPEVFVKIN